MPSDGSVQLEDKSLSFLNLLAEGLWFGAIIRSTERSPARFEMPCLPDNRPAPQKLDKEANEWGAEI